MQYLHSNNDGTIGIITLLPIGVVGEGIEVTIIGLRRKNGKSLIYGSAVIDGVDSGVEFVIGDEFYDVGDLEENSLPGYTIIFPDINKDILRKYPAHTKDQISYIRKMKRSEIPSDRYFRNAWRDGGKTIEHDIAKCKDIHLEKLRRQREPLLAQLDVDWMKATGQNKKQEADAIEAKRQALRDFPQTIKANLDKAKTPDEIKAITLPI